MLLMIYFVVFSVLMHIKIFLIHWYTFLIFFIMILPFLWVSYNVQLMRKQQLKKNPTFSFIFLWIVQMNSWIIKVKCSGVMKHNLILLVYKAHKICHSSSATCTLIETTLNISRKTRRRLLFFRLVTGFYGFASCLTLDFPGYMHDSRSMILQF